MENPVIQMIHFDTCSYVAIDVLIYRKIVINHVEIIYHKSCCPDGFIEIKWPKIQLNSSSFASLDKSQDAIIFIEEEHRVEIERDLITKIRTLPYLMDHITGKTFEDVVNRNREK